MSYKKKKGRLLRAASFLKGVLWKVYYLKTLISQGFYV